MSGYALGQEYGTGVFPQAKIDGVQPAAGSNFIFKPSGTYVWRLVSIVFKLTTDATAGNRYVAVEYQGDNGNAFSVNASTVTLAPSQTGQRYAAYIGNSESASGTGTDILFGLAPIFLHGGDTVAITITNKGAGDQLSAIELVFDQLPTDPTLLGAV